LEQITLQRGPVISVPQTAHVLKLEITAAPPA
jgi:hypothetical protein